MTARPGVFIAVVGPSGAGKDSLIRGVAQRTQGDREIVIVRRVVTRPSDAHEDHEPMTKEAFAAAERAGLFALAWDAHGLRYGVPASVDAEIARGAIAICNLSRAAVGVARGRYALTRVALVTASDETLAARLAMRGRETPDVLRARLQRAGELASATTPDLTIVNDGPLSEAVAAFHDFVLACRESLTA